MPPNIEFPGNNGEPLNREVETAVVHDLDNYRHVTPEATDSTEASGIPILRVIEGGAVADRPNPQAQQPETSKDSAIRRVVQRAGNVALKLTSSSRYDGLETFTTTPKRYYRTASHRRHPYRHK